MADITRRHSGGIFSTWISSETTVRNSQLPAVNNCEDKKCYIVDVVALGFKNDDFQINMDDDLLTISAETKQER
ncbi:Hsp20/alpha crystallin family protein [Flavisolibacter nicotianae]|uniref:Hsp20/alpha crystallin family protein n=1 Tax=Flavisolibacter nicotianae TaxID=2364882 RepID=UPI000EAC73AF|nr:Hsp20/alpha crystallin family protein [Flavisolibacter nicotianae]